MNAAIKRAAMPTFTRRRILHLRFAHEQGDLLLGEVAWRCWLDSTVTMGDAGYCIDAAQVLPGGSVCRGHLDTAAQAVLGRE